MSKKFFLLIIAGLCFGQGESELSNISKIALGITGGVNYAIYIDKYPSSAKTISAPRINIGINSRFKLISHLSDVCELSYLRLFYNSREYGYIYDSIPFPEDHITFDDIYLSSELKIAVLKKQLLTTNIGIGLAGIWPFRGTWDSYPLSYKNVNDCRALFLSETIGLEFEKFPFDNILLSLGVRTHYCIARTTHPYIGHPFVLRSSIAISGSIPLQFTLSLLMKM